MADINRLIELNIEIQGLLRVLRDNDSQEVRDMLTRKFGLMAESVGELGGTDHKDDDEPVDVPVAIEGVVEAHSDKVDTRELESEIVTREQSNSARDLDRVAKAALTPVEIEDEDDDDVTVEIDSNYDDDYIAIASTEVHNESDDEGDGEVAIDIDVEPEPADEYLAASVDPLAEVQADDLAPVEINERLLHAFTINDRFRFCRELFGGDQEDFADTLSVLAEMPDYAEAEDYLFHDLMWDPSNPEVEAFMQILSGNMPS
ncbi:MAG: hypothetical protein K2L16_00460 [Muribaculaceae bacterium]|nr:hypothetical protein [Muribaculaceae bacterium]